MDPFALKVAEVMEEGERPAVAFPLSSQQASIRGSIPGAPAPSPQPPAMSAALASAPAHLAQQRASKSNILGEEYLQIH